MVNAATGSNLGKTHDQLPRTQPNWRTISSKAQDSVMKGIAVIIVLGGAMLMLMCSTTLVGIRKAKTRASKNRIQLTDLPQRFQSNIALSLT
jgi:hypothetical protein